jgi:hypothetical protein
MIDTVMWAYYKFSDSSIEQIARLQKFLILINSKIRSSGSLPHEVSMMKQHIIQVQDYISELKVKFERNI